MKHPNHQPITRIHPDHLSLPPDWQEDHLDLLPLAQLRNLLHPIHLQRLMSQILHLQSVDLLAQGPPQFSLPYPFQLGCKDRSVQPLPPLLRCQSHNLLSCHHPWATSLHLQDLPQSVNRSDQELPWLLLFPPRPLQTVKPPVQEQSGSRSPAQQFPIWMEHKGLKTCYSVNP